MKYLSVVVVIIAVLLVIIVAVKPSYFKIVNDLYKNLPRLIVIVISLLSLFGLSKTISNVGETESPHQTPIRKEGVEGGYSSPWLRGGEAPPSEAPPKRLVSETTKKLVAAKQKWQCGLCHRTLDETYEIDHIVPLYRGGSNDVSNLMALDPICHRKKTNADRLGLDFLPKS